MLILSRKVVQEKSTFKQYTLCAKEKYLKHCPPQFKYRILFVWVFLYIKRKETHAFGGRKVQITAYPPLAVGTLHTEPGTLRAGHYLYKQVKQGLIAPPGAMWPALSVNTYRCVHSGTDELLTLASLVCKHPKAAEVQSCSSCSPRPIPGTFEVKAE